MTIARAHRHLPPHRRLATRLAAVTAGVGATLALPAVASAHVTLEPDTVEGGSFSVVSVRVPNERDDAATTRVRVLLPADQPLGSVQTTPVPGWRVTTAERELDEPLDFFGSELSRVVSEVTWTATDGGVRPGQFQDFPLSLGQLPESGELVMSAVQTYSSGERVAWNEVAVDDAAEPERPAPVLTVTAPGDDDGGADQVGAADATAGDDQAAAAAPVADPGAEEGAGSALSVALAATALVVALGALVLAWRRRA